MQTDMTSSGYPFSRKMFFSCSTSELSLDWAQIFALFKAIDKNLGEQLRRKKISDNFKDFPKTKFRHLDINTAMITACYQYYKGHNHYSKDTTIILWGTNIKFV